MNYSYKRLDGLLCFWSADVLATTRKQNTGLDSAYGQLTCLYVCIAPPQLVANDHKHTDPHKQVYISRRNLLLVWFLQELELLPHIMGFVLLLFCDLGLTPVVQPLILSIVSLISLINCLFKICPMFDSLQLKSIKHHHGAWRSITSFSQLKCPTLPAGVHLPN